MAFSVTGSLLLIEIQRGKEGLKKSKYHMELGTMAACTKSMMETTKGLGKKDLQGSIHDCFIFES